MGLKMKTFREILNGMIGWISQSNSKLTNFYVGSVIRTLLEAISVEIESLYFQMHRGFRNAIENSIFHSFNFYKFPATPATGELRLVFGSPLTQKLIIPKGYEFSTTPVNGEAIYFKTIEDTLVSYGVEEAVVQVECTQSGVIGNVPAFSIRRISVPIPVIREVYNASAFLTGKPEETKEERKKRFTRYIDTLSRGTISAVQYGCLRVQGVTGAYVDESIGVVNVYVHDAAGNLSEELRQEVLQSLIEYRSAGIEVIVSPVVKKPVDLDISVVLNPGFDPDKYKTIIEDSVTSYLNYYSVSRDLIKADVIKYIMSIDENAILNMSINLEGDVMADKYELIRAGTITVTI